MLREHCSSCCTCGMVISRESFAWVWSFKVCVPKVCRCCFCFGRGAEGSWITSYDPSQQSERLLWGFPARPVREWLGHIGSTRRCRTGGAANDVHHMGVAETQPITIPRAATRFLRVRGNSRSATSATSATSGHVDHLGHVVPRKPPNGPSWLFFVVTMRFNVGRPFPMPIACP